MMRPDMPTRRDRIFACMVRLASEERSWKRVLELAAFGEPAVEPIFDALNGIIQLQTERHPRDVNDDLSAALQEIGRRYPNPLLAALETGRGCGTLPWILCEIGEERAIPLLEKLVSHGKPDDRRAAEAAISNLRKGKRKGNAARKRR